MSSRSRCCFARSRVRCGATPPPSPPPRLEAEAEAVLSYLGGVKGRGTVETSARRWLALFASIFSWPRSCFKESIIDVISLEERRGVLQNVQGPRPSFTQMILPQFRQLGAAARSGCLVALQEQARAEADWEEDKLSEGLVWSSRVRIAESRSCRVVEAPCMDAPPAILIVVLGAGEEVREDVREPVRTFGRSDIRGPEAEGGGLSDGPVVVFGNWRASGLFDKANVFASPGSWFCDFLLPAMYSSCSLFW